MPGTVSRTGHRNKRRLRNPRHQYIARVVIAIGEPYFVPGDTPLDDLEVHRVKMQDALMSLMDESRKVLDNKGNADG